MLTTLTVGTLTTVFTPSSSCFDLQTLTLPPRGSDTYMHQTNDDFLVYSFGYRKDCYPANFDQVDFYEPGILPHGFLTMSLNVDTDSITAATGCSSGYWLSSLTVNDNILPVGCLSSLETRLTVVNGTQTSMVPREPFQNYLTVRYAPIVIKYRSEDLSLFSTASPTSGIITTNPTATPKITSSLPRATAAPTAAIVPMSDLSASLSDGAKAGIGVGSVFGAMAIVIGIVIVLRRGRRHTFGQVGFDGKAELDGRGKYNCPTVTTETNGDGRFHEVDGSCKAVELGDQNTRAELEGNWVGWEAPTANERDDIAGAIQYIQLHD